MYPKNAASPQRVAIGAVVQISDGAVQASGVSVKVMPQGGAAGAGGGTIAYEEGIVHYVPTQAETNYASFMLIAYKTGCIPVAVTIVTTISSTAGHAGIDWANVIAPTTTLNLSGTTIKTATDVETDTADIQSRIPAALGANGNIKADVRDFNGTAGTFSSGRPEVNTTHIAGTAWASTTLFTLASHDPGATLGTSTLTQTQVTGGAYALNSASFAFNAALDLTTTQKASVNAEADTALADVGLTTTITGRIDVATSTRLASASYTAPLDAAGTRTALGLASANLDTQLSTIAADAAAADTRGERVVCRGTVTTGSSTTSITTSAFSPAGAAADQFKGRIVIFDVDTATAALRGQATDITASSNSATPTFTVTALTTAPSSGDTFTVV